MNVELKIKIKSLAAEAGIIRHEERKLVRPKPRSRGLRTLKSGLPVVVPVERRTKTGAIPWARDHQKTKEVAALDMRYNKLRHHRTIVLRREARASQLAYAYLRGRRYDETEHKDSVFDSGVIATAARLIGKYGEGHEAVEETYNLEQRFKLIRQWINGE